MKELGLIILVALGAIFWLQNMRIGEIAKALAKRACQQAGVQFLDDSVSFKRFSFGRNQAGSVALFRYYVFEFATDGSQRMKGRICLQGRRIEELVLDMHDAL